MKKQTRNDQIENCLVMIDAVKSLPARAFVPHLNEWRCGSAACLGGWVAQHPHFMKKGIYPNPEDGAPITGRIWSMEIAHKLFGRETVFWAERLEEQNFSPKEIALNRLNAALNELLEPW